MSSSDVAKILNRANKNWAHLKKIKYFENQSFFCRLIFFTEKKIRKIPLSLCWKLMTLKVRIFHSLRMLFIILVGPTMTWFIEKMLISNVCIRGLMPNLFKKSWTVSVVDSTQPTTNNQNFLPLLNFALKKCSLVCLGQLANFDEMLNKERPKLYIPCTINI